MGQIRTCAVSFLDPSGIRHSTEVTAETLYEAAVLGIRAISQEWGIEPAQLTPIEIEVRAPATLHSVTLRHIRQWLDGASRSPKERVLRDRLREMLTY